MKKHLLAACIAVVMLASLAGCAAPAQTSAGADGTQVSEAASQPADSVAQTGEASSQTSDDVEQASKPADQAGDNTTEQSAQPSTEARENNGADNSSSSAVADEQTRFATWNADAKSLATLVAYVEAATEEGGAGYVPPADRIAVFDMDGTFLCEKAPVYIDYMLLLHRVQDDPSFTPTDEMRALCDEIRASANKGVPLNDANRAYKKNDALAEAFAGMTFDEFHAYIADFMANVDAEGFSGMTYGESFYRPMLEVISYLKSNDFDVYVVSASEREVVRAIVEPLDIDASHVIGSDWAYTATNQGDAEGTDYTYEQADDLMIAGYYLGETGKTNKVIAIQREIGKHPVLAFGNSSGDFAMLNYALDNDKYPSAAFLVIADDTQREYGNDDKAAEMRASAAEAGWTTISMRNDWSTIYGDGVAKTQLPL